MSLLYEWLDHAAGARRGTAGGGQALVYRDTYLSWHGLQHRVDRRANELKGAGIEAGDWVGLMLGSVPEFVVLALALSKLDAVVVPLDPILGGRDLDMVFAAAHLRALVTRPKLLLMDEPFAALDEITRLRLNDELIDLWQRFGWTVIFVTHSVLESVYLSRHVVVMATKPGRLFGALDVAAPYPRGENFRTSPTYADDCRRVSETLHAAMAAN